MSLADRIFIKNVRNILENGISDEGMSVRPRWDDGTPAHTISLFGVVDRYDLSQEFPILTLRRTFWKSAWDEIAWIWQKKSNNIKDLGSHIWDSWADADGTIGKAYGYQMGVKSRYRDITEEGLRAAFGDRAAQRLAFKDPDGVYRLDQTDRVIYQLVNDPASRRIMTNMYTVSDLSDMALSPCAYSMTFKVSGRKLNAILNQRSQDMITANAWNTVQAALLVHAFASAYGFTPGVLLHVISDCHIYDRHIEIAKKLIREPEHDAPDFQVDPHVRDFYSFSAQSFKFTNYSYNEFSEKIPVAI
ncbi:MAG: thymidylate synthase [Lachnospiraceae bacterium]|nr:thymidylate synthase [Lachnospiraceae bacterium]